MLQSFRALRIAAFAAATIVAASAAPLAAQSSVENQLSLDSNKTFVAGPQTPSNPKTFHSGNTPAANQKVMINSAQPQIPSFKPREVDQKINSAALAYFEDLFAKNYEGAAARMSKGADEKTIAKMEKWRDRFMSPSAPKVISQKANADGSVTAVVTFNYKNANGVEDLKREKITLSPATDGSAAVKNFDTLDSFVVPVEIPPMPQTPQIPSAPNSGGGANAVDMINNLLSQSSKGGTSAPNLTSIISAVGANGAANIDPGELLGLITELSSDPDVMALAANPKIMALAKDPAVMNTLLSGNMAAIEKDQRIKELLSDPAVAKIVEKIKNRRENGASASPAAPPSSINGVDVDKIFE